VWVSTPRPSGLVTPPGGQPDEGERTAGVGEPRYPASAVFHPLAASSKGVPSAPIPSLAGVDGTAVWKRELSPATDYSEIFGSEVAQRHFPLLASLQRWRWWWVENSPDVPNTLIGQYVDTDDGLTMIYVDADHVALIRTGPDGKVHDHRRGHLAAVVAECERLVLT
jgi:hypothetical protein